MKKTQRVVLQLQVLLCNCCISEAIFMYFLVQVRHSSVLYTPGQQEKKWPKTSYNTGIILL